MTSGAGTVNVYEVEDLNAPYGSSLQYWTVLGDNVSAVEHGLHLYLWEQHGLDDPNFRTRPIAVFDAGDVEVLEDGDVYHPGNYEWLVLDDTVSLIYKDTGKNVLDG